MLSGRKYFGKPISLPSSFITMSTQVPVITTRGSNVEMVSAPDNSSSSKEGIDLACPSQDVHEAELQPPYSIYTSRQKNFIVLMSGLGGFFSPLSANTYLPAIPTLASFLNVSPSLMNLTVTAFLILQGLAPSFYGDLADIAGRRPAYLISFIVYIVANIGLATQSSYPALFILRCLQVCWL